MDIDGRRPGGRFWVEQVKAIHLAQDAGQRGIDGRHRHGSATDRGLERIAEIRSARAAGDLAARHLQIQAGGEGERAVDRAPVRRDEAREAPLAAQDSVLERGVLTRPSAVDAVVGAHGRCGAGLHSRLKRREVDLAQRALVDDDVFGPVVPGQVLHLRHDALALNAGDLRGAQARAEQRVFAESGVIAAEEGIADDVNVRGEQDVLFERPCIAAHHDAVEAGGLRVKGGCQADGRGHGGGIAVDVDAAGAIGEAERRDAEARQAGPVARFA